MPADWHESRRRSGRPSSLPGRHACQTPSACRGEATCRQLPTRPTRSSTPPLETPTRSAATRTVKSPMRTSIVSSLSSELRDARSLVRGFHEVRLGDRATDEVVDDRLERSELLLELCQRARDARGLRPARVLERGELALVVAFERLSRRALLLEL